MSVSMSLNLPPLSDPQIEALFHSQSIQKGSTTFSWEREKKILYPTNHLNIDKQGYGKIQVEKSCFVKKAMFMQVK